MINADRFKLEVRRSLRPFLLYVLLAFSGLVAFLVIAHNLTFQRPWTPYRTLRADFSDVKGIVPGKHQVRISGVEAGVVSKSEIVGGHPVLTLKVKKKFGPIYRNARLQIRPVTPLDDLYVNVTDRGTPSAGEATVDHPIAVDRTITPVDISRVLDTFDGDTRKRLTILLAELGRGLKDGGAQLQASFAQLGPFLDVAQRATSELALRRANVRRLVHNFGGLSAALARRDAQLTTLVRQGDAALGELARNDQPLGGTLTGLPPAMAAMRSSFASVRALAGDLDPALQSLRPVAARLPAGLDGLGRFGRDATPALAALRPAVRNLRPLARVLVPTSRALDEAFGSLRPQAPQFDELTKELATCRASAQTFFNNTLQVFKFADANGSFPRAEVTEDSDAGQVGQNGSSGVTLKRMPTCIDGIGGGR